MDEYWNSRATTPKLIGASIIQRSDDPGPSTHTPGIPRKDTRKGVGISFGLFDSFLDYSHVEYGNKFPN